MLQLQPTDVTVRALLPDRPNIFLNVVRQRSYNEEEDLAWVVDGLRAQGSDFPKTVIFAQSIRQVCEFRSVFVIVNLLFSKIRLSTTN